jgi:hypothetical protein
MSRAASAGGLFGRDPAPFEIIVLTAQEDLNGVTKLCVLRHLIHS